MDDFKQIGDSDVLSPRALKIGPDPVIYNATTLTLKDSKIAIRVNGVYQLETFEITFPYTLQNSRAEVLDEKVRHYLTTRNRPFPATEFSDKYLRDRLIEKSRVPTSMLSSNEISASAQTSWVIPDADKKIIPASELGLGQFWQKPVHASIPPVKDYPPTVSIASKVLETPTVRTISVAGYGVASYLSTLNLQFPSMVDFRVLYTGQTMTFNLLRTPDLDTYSGRDNAVRTFILNLEQLNEGPTQAWAPESLIY